MIRQAFSGIFFARISCLVTHKCCTEQQYIFNIRDVKTIVEKFTYFMFIRFGERILRLFMKNNFPVFS
jgi:hypothetical protein